MFTQRRFFEAGSLIFIIAFAFIIWRTRTHAGVLESISDDVTIRTPASGAQIDEALRAVGAWAMVGLGDAFKHAERVSGINAVFLAAIAVHESNKGTSRIAREKNNLFGWGAVDADPFDKAFSFSSRENGIEHVALRLRAEYVDKRGLKTIAQIGSRYASDSDWAGKVIYWCRRLQDEISN